MPLLSAVEDRLIVLRRIGPLAENLARALSGVRDWVQTKAAGDPQRADELRQACVTATPEIGPHSSWADLVTVNLTARLIELIEFGRAVSILQVTLRT